jgi:hypothetical protein
MIRGDLRQEEKVLVLDDTIQKNASLPEPVEGSERNLFLECIFDLSMTGTS